MTTLSRRERRLIAVAILVAVVALVIFGLIMPVVDGFADRADARTALLATYARDERAIVQIASVRRAAEAQRTDMARFRLPGVSVTAAGDLLKERLGAAVAATGGDLRSTEDIAATAGTIRVRVDARLTNSQLVALLTGLQRGEPLLVLDNLTVTADQAFQTGRIGPMDVHLEVSGSYPTAAPR